MYGATAEPCNLFQQPNCSLHSIVVSQSSKTCVRAASLSLQGHNHLSPALLLLLLLLLLIQACLLLVLRKQGKRLALGCIRSQRTGATKLPSTCASKLALRGHVCRRAQRGGTRPMSLLLLILWLLLLLLRRLLLLLLLMVLVVLRMLLMLCAVHGRPLRRRSSLAVLLVWVRLWTHRSIVRLRLRLRRSRLRQVPPDCLRQRARYRRGLRRRPRLLRSACRPRSRLRPRVHCRSRPLRLRGRS